MMCHRWDSVPKGSFVNFSLLEPPSDVFPHASFRGSFFRPRLHLRFETALALSCSSEHSHKIRDERPKESERAYDAGLELLRQSHFEARRLISGVRPPILDESGVVAAVAHLVYELRTPKGPKVEFRSKVEFSRLAPILENAIYRIAQEGLANARAHSESKKVSVGLMQRGDRLRIVIRDQGIGFDPKTVEEGRFGLEGIRERARLLGGKLAIDSAPGRGARIVVDLPIVLRTENTH